MTCARRLASLLLLLAHPRRGARCSRSSRTGWRRRGTRSSGRASPRSRARADSRATAELERAAKAAPADRDLAYLLATQLRRAGRYEDAADLYREVLQRGPGRRRRAQQPRQHRVRPRRVPGGARPLQARGREGAPTARRRRVFFYNQSLAHLQRFEMQPADEALSQAARLVRASSRPSTASGSTTRATTRWSTSGLTTEDVEQKFAGMARGHPAARTSAPGGAAPRPSSPLPALAQPLRRLPRGGRPGGRRALALARAQDLHHALPEVRHALLPALPPRGGGGGPVHPVLPPLRGARRGVGSRPQPEAARGPGRGRPAGPDLPRPLPALPRAPARSTAARRSWALGLSLRLGLVIALGLLAGRVFPVTEAPARSRRCPWGLVRRGPAPRRHLRRREPRRSPRPTSSCPSAAAPPRAAGGAS